MRKSLFNVYVPVGHTESAARGRAVLAYNRVAEYMGKAEVGLSDYYAYKLHLLRDEAGPLLQDREALSAWLDAMTEKWEHIIAVKNHIGEEQVPGIGYKVYIIIYEDEGMKVGYANDVVRRYSGIQNAENRKIKTMYYLDVENLQHAKRAENAIRNYFGHARKIQHMGIGDHFQGNTKDIEKFFKHHKRAIYDMIKNA